MLDFVCQECSKPFTAEELPRRGEVCFGCHVRTIRLGFTHGRDDFHGPTIAERQRQTVADAKVNGYNAEPVGTRWV